MGVLLAIGYAVLWAVLGLVLLVVLVPFRARASGSVHDGAPAGEARVDWGLGLLSVTVDARRRVAVRVAELPVARFDLRTRGERDGKGGRRRRRREAERPRKKAGAPARLRAVLGEGEAFRGMAARLARALHLRLRASGRVGAGDPADTAALAALVAALGALPGVELALGLDWVDEALELDLELAARIWMAELLAVAAVLLLARPHRRALRAAFGALRT
jgi:hypothetical protein